MRRLYSEHVPLSALDRPVLRALGRRNIELAVALWPETRAEFAALRRRAAEVGTELILWPLLSDRHGRWLLDMEPPIAWTRSVLRDTLAPPRSKASRAGQLLRHTPRLRRDAGASHRALASSLKRAGWRVDVVAPPMLSFGGRWQRWLGTSIEGLSDRAFEPMAYTSLFEGYSYGLVDRRVARDLLARLARRSSAVSLGVVGGGALGDERPYRDVSELVDDIAICRASGVERLSLYALDGMLARGPIEPWLDAFVRTQPGVTPGRTRRGTLLEALAGALG
jgi:hypothetical protein